MVSGISIIMNTNLDGISIELNLESFIRKLRRLNCRPFLGASCMDKCPDYSLTTGHP